MMKIDFLNLNDFLSHKNYVIKCSQEKNMIVRWDDIDFNMLESVEKIFSEAIWLEKEISLFFFLFILVFENS